MLASLVLSMAITFGTAAYFAPALVAVRTGHPRSRAILAANLAIGWTLVAWPALLHWACGSFGERAGPAPGIESGRPGAAIPRAMWPVRPRG